MAKKTSENTKVTRITASDSAKKLAKKSNDDDARVTKVTSTAKLKKAATPKSDKKEKSTPMLLKPFALFFGYFAGAWSELRQVHWPTRRATWSLTGAVLLFSVFFILFILLIDTAFKYLFETILQ